MQVSMRELKSNLAKYVQQTRAGEPIEVTSHRKVVARISGVASADGSAASRLLAAGVATWEGGKPGGAALELTPTGTRVSEMVLADRG